MCRSERSARSTPGFASGLQRAKNGPVRSIRPALVVLIVSLLVACTSRSGENSASSRATSSSVAQPAPVSSAAVATPPATAAAPAEPAVTASRRCTNEDLRLTAGQDLGSLMRQPAAYFGLLNRSSSPCKVQGYPTVTFFHGAGQRINPARQLRGGPYQINDPGPAEVSLAPGASAWFGVGWIAENPDGGHDGCVDPSAISVVPPGASRQMRIPIQLKAWVCPSGSVIVTAIGQRTSFRLGDPAA